MNDRGPAGAGLVDTHCHLEDLGDVDRVLSEAAAAGVTTLVAMGVDGPTSLAAATWAATRPGLRSAAGHHPLNQAGPDLGLLRELGGRPQVVAVGEVGIDHVDEHRGPHDAQERWFGDLCGLARDLDLPVCVHTRGSAEAVQEVMAAHPGLRAVMHYWALDWAWAERFLELGCYLSFSGVVTRRSHATVLEVAARVPEDRLLLETDSPWGTPRGRSGPMRPAWMVETARVVAEARGLSLERLSEVEAANARSLFTRLA